MCVETIQGISLYSYLYLKLAKIPCFSYYLLYFFFYKETRGQNRFWWEVGVDMAQVMHMHASKYKNDKKKKRTHSYLWKPIFPY
jgi:hypothetical protein